MSIKATTVENLIATLRQTNSGVVGPLVRNELIRALGELLTDLNKPKHEPVMDLDAVQEAYKFGGLLVHQVEYLDPVTWNPVVDLYTLDAREADGLASQLKRLDRLSRIKQFHVRFGKAFSNNQQTK